MCEIIIPGITRLEQTTVRRFGFRQGCGGLSSPRFVDSAQEGAEVKLWTVYTSCPAFATFALSGKKRALNNPPLSEKKILKVAYAKKIIISMLLHRRCLSVKILPLEKVPLLSTGQAGAAARGRRHPAQCPLKGPPPSPLRHRRCYPPPFLPPHPPPQQQF